MDASLGSGARDLNGTNWIHPAVLPGYTSTRWFAASSLCQRTKDPPPPADDGGLSNYPAAMARRVGRFSARRCSLILACLPARLGP